MGANVILFTFINVSWVQIYKKVAKTLVDSGNICNFAA